MAFSIIFDWSNFRFNQAKQYLKFIKAIERKTKLGFGLRFCDSWPWDSSVEKSL